MSDLHALRLFELVLMGAVAFAALGYLLPWWFTRRSKADTEERLVRLCYGDRNLAERLIAFEMARRPGISRGDAVGFVLARLGRDRR